MEELPLRPKSTTDISSQTTAPDTFNLTLRPHVTAEVNNIHTAIAGQQEPQAQNQTVTNHKRKRQNHNTYHRRKLRRAHLKQNLDDRAVSLSLNREDPAQEAKLHAELKKQDTEKSRNENPPRQTLPRENQHQRDIRSLCTDAYWLKEIAILKDGNRNAARIESLQDHFSKNANLKALKGKNYVREEMKQRELGLRVQWKQGEVPEPQAIEGMKDIAFGLTLVNGTVLESLKMDRANASVLLSEIPRLKRKVEAEGDIGLDGEVLCVEMFAADVENSDESEEEVCT